MRNILFFFIFLLLLSCNQNSSNKEMVKLLDEIRIKNYSRENPFSPEARLEVVDSLLASNGGKETVSAEMLTKAEVQQASLLLQVGNEKKAFQLLRNLMYKVGISDAMYYPLLKSYALTALRFGERQNCIMNHSPEACVMPIVGPGVHQNTSGSEAAIESYQKLLKLDSSDLQSRWLLNIAYMTLGDYPGRIPSQWLIPGLDSDKADYQIKRFTDIAPGLLMDSRNKAGGVIVDDFNNDGFLDVVTSDLGLDGAMHYFKNDGKGTFADISTASSIGLFKGGLNMIQADYNNDGYIDILVLRGGWMPGSFGKQPMSLLKNNGDDTFTDMTVASGLFVLHPTQTAVWRDFNNDGWLDLFVGNESAGVIDFMYPCELFINDKQGNFKDVGSLAHCNLTSFVKGVTASDYDNDGLTDIFISTCQGRRILLRNTGIKNGIPQFEDRTNAAGLDDQHFNTFPTWFFDYDNDGWQDIFVCGYQPSTTMAYSVAADALNLPDERSSTIYLYHNNQNGTFTNVSKEAGLDHAVFAMGSNFGDIDNDGYLDMYLGTGNPDYASLVPNKLIRISRVKDLQTSP